MRRIAIHGVPRSGTTWLGSIFDSSPAVIYRYQPLFSYTHKGALTPTSSLAGILHFYRAIQSTKDPFVLQERAIKEGLVPAFKKDSTPVAVAYKEVRYHHILENLAAQDTDIRIIGIIRHPLSVLSSWIKAPKEYKPEWNLLEEWRFAPKKNEGRPEEFYGFEKWKEVAYLFEKLCQTYPDRCTIVRYSDLLAHTPTEVQRLFDFCGLPMTRQTLDFIAASHSKEVDNAYSVFKIKKEDADWTNTLPLPVIRAVNEELIHTSLEKYLTD